MKKKATLENTRKAFEVPMKINWTVLLRKIRWNQNIRVILR